MSGNWVGAPGTLYFNVVHRFTASAAPERKVSNAPTFLLAAGLPKRLLAGFNYSSNSTLAPRFPNEWELFARWAPVSEDFDAPFDVGAQVGYNNAASGVDGEVSVAKKLGAGRFILAGRVLSDPLEAGQTRFAVAGGATIRLGQYVAFAGDIASFTNRDSTKQAAWSAGLHFAIPLTPHTVSLHATNTAITTLQGASRGSDNIRYGFEFTIPLTLRRYFGGRAESPSDTASPLIAAIVDSTAPLQAGQPDSVRRAPQPASAAPAPPSDTVSAPMADTARARARTTKVLPTPSKPAAPAARITRTTIKSMNFLQPKLQITVGTTVEWEKRDLLPHTVTAVGKSFDSGLIPPGKKYRHTFTKAGTFPFICTPHPFMKGTVVVKDP